MGIVTVSHFHPNLIYAGKAEAYPCGAVNTYLNILDLIRLNKIE
jgi:hypothetical protein